MAMMRSAVDTGLQHLQDGSLHDAPAALSRRIALLGAPVLMQTPNRVLDNDDCPIDEEAEVDGAEAHEIPAGARGPNQQDGEEHRQLDGGRHAEAYARPAPRRPSPRRSRRLRPRWRRSWRGWIANAPWPRTARPFGSSGER